MAADPASGTVVLFGGAGGGQFPEMDDTWTWDGDRWTFGAYAPSFRNAATMAYDGARRKVLLFGGEDGNNHNDEHDDTWSWDGATREWTEEAPLPLLDTPPKRSHAAMAYDEATATIVLFGGYAEGGDVISGPAGPRNDTWVWDGSTRTWARQAPPVSPPARSGAAMAFDAVTGKVLLFGGSETNDTWSWDGVAKTWTMETPAVAPPPTDGGSMAYHAASRKVVFFGGSTGAVASGDATWTWDGTTRSWTRRAPLVSPPGRRGAAMAYHSATGTAVLFGGIDDGTWAWDGANWSQRVRPALSIGDVTVVEGDSGTRDAMLTVGLSEPVASTVTVDYGVYQRFYSGTLSFAPGVTSRTIRVPISGDTVDRPDGQLPMTLSSAVGAVIADGAGVVTVLDDDPAGPGPRLAVGDARVYEGDAGKRAALFTVSLSKAATSTVAVAYATADAGATGSHDFVARSGTLSFAPGVTSLTVKVPVVPDVVSEGSESFAVTLSAGSGAKISRANGIGTIVDDD